MARSRFPYEAMVLFTPLRRAALQASFRISLLAMASGSLASAQTYVFTLEPGATVWDEFTANWRNPQGQLVPYVNADQVTPVIDGPRNVGVALPRIMGTLSLNDGVLLTGAPLTILQGSEIISSFGRNTINNNMVLSPYVGEMIFRGQLGFNGAVNMGGAPVKVIGGTTLGPGASLTSGRLQIGTLPEPGLTYAGTWHLLITNHGSVVNTQGDLIVGPLSGSTGLVESAGTVFNVAGDLKLAHGGNCRVLASNCTFNLAGNLRIADQSSGLTSFPNYSVSLRGSTLIVADTGKPGIGGDYFVAATQTQADPFELPGTRVNVRPGGFLTVHDRIEMRVDNTIFDTTGGDAVIHARMSGRTLIKEGPGILKLTRDNYHGVGVADSTLVRGGFVEFTDLTNLGNSGAVKNIQLNGGGMRWAPGSTVDISHRFRLLNEFSFDTNGNNVGFATPLAGTGGMTKLGVGTLSFGSTTGTNTYSGGTAVKGGFLEFRSLNTFGTGSVTLDGGGLRWSANHPVDLMPRMAPLGAGGGTLDTNGNNVSFDSGSLSGPGSLTKIGEGALSIQGTHPWTGALHINGGSMTLNGAFPGKAQLVVGDAGAGALTLNGTLSTTTQTRIGNAPGIAGTANVSGSLSNGSFLEIGTGGSGTLNVSNGGQVSSATSTALAVLPGSSGTVNVTGASSLTTGTTLFVGYQGTAVMTVGSGGVVTVGEQLSCGHLPGGSGAFVLAQGGTLNVGGTDGIRTGTGESGFYLSGGTLKVTGSSLTSTLPMVCTNQSLIDTSGVDCVLGGTLSGAGGFTKVGGGILYLNVPNSYAGGTSLYGGQIVVPAANSLGTGNLSIFSGNVHSTGTFSRDTNVTVNEPGASLTAGSYMEFGVGGTGTLAVTGGGQVTTPGSVAFGVLGGGTLGLADVSGAGSSLSCGTTMYIGYLSSGRVTVGTGGSVSVGGQILLGAGNASQGFFNLNTGGTLNVGGTNGIAKGDGAATFNLAGGTLKVTGSDLTSTLPMTLSQLSLIDTSGVTCTLGGALSGTGGIAKTGAGTLTLSGANTYTGNTAVFAGTLVLENTTLADTADVAVSSGTVLHLSFTGADTVRRFIIDGVVQSTGTWGSPSSAATNKTALITGPGLLNVTSIGAADFTISPPANNSGTVGQPYSGTFTQSGAFGSLTWSHDPFGPAGTPPPGLTLSSTGVLSGTPTSAGTFGFTVKVTDPNGFFAYHVGEFTFTHPVITVQNPGIASGRKNVAFSQTFTSTGGNGASTFTLSSGTLPAGLTLAGNGTLSGTPTVAGNFPITVTATDIYGGTATGASYALSIAETSADANLAALGVSSGILTPAFTSGTTAYQINVSPDVALLYVVPTAADPLASITVNGSTTANGGDSPGIPLEMGANPISILVTSSDFSTQKTYTLNANRTGGLVLTGGGLTLLEEGGTFGPGNVAPDSTGFAKDVVPGYAAHSIEHLNDATFGNENSWIAETGNSFAGISLGATPIRVNEFAFGRDNLGVFNDRSLTRYILQSTTTPHPDAATPDASWTTIGILDYLSPGGPNFSAPALRHRYGFTPVMATGLRLVVVDAGTALDEIEVYPQVGLVLSGGGLKLEAEGGTIAPGNLARGAGATPFADGVLAGFSAHAIPHLNDGNYGNEYSWINDIPAPFAGVALGSSRSVDRIAFGRDNTGVFTDRTFGIFTLQYTNEPNPGAATPADSWITIGTLDYQFAGGYRFATPSRRHLYSFQPVTATALRLVGSTGNNSFDEIEIYREQPKLLVEQPVGTPLASNTGGVAFGRIQAGTTADKTFTLTNIGSNPLTLGAITLAGSNPGDFTFTDPASNTLAAGETTTLTVTFVPLLQETLSSAVLHIASDDPEISDFIIPLTGTGTSPPPILAPYGNITNSASSASGIVVLYPPANAIDASGNPPTLSYSHPSGSLFPIGTTTVTITATDAFNNTTTGTFTVTITATNHPPEVPISGTVPNNLALGKTAFAKDVVGVAPHTIAKVNDGLYGNPSSWIADTLDSFVGINLGATPVPIHRIAFGRDHTGQQTTRATGTYTLQYTTTPNPDASTPDGAWQTIATLVYPNDVTSPALRHLFAIPAVNATGIRLKTLGDIFPIGIDELELYGPLTPQQSWRNQYFSTTANTGDAADLADPNHNGIPNLLEYALGGHPVDGSTGQSILPTGSRPGNQMQLHFTRLLDRNDVDLTVQASPNLTTWTDLARSTAGQPFALLESGTVIEETGTGNTRAVIITDPATDTRRFMRLSVTPAPSP